MRTNLKSQVPPVDNPEENYGILDVLELPPSKLMHNFTPVNYKDVIKLTKSSPSKSCELDPIPTSLLKGMITELATPIALVVNSSLHQGIFSSTVKETLLRPLLKKINLDPIKKNYISSKPWLLHGLLHEKFIPYQQIVLTAVWISQKDSAN